jgi:thioredoxin 1
LFISLIIKIIFNLFIPESYLYKFNTYNINLQLRRLMKDINAEEYNELLSSEAPVVIDFHATWCGPCKVLSPILEELSDEVTGVEFVKLDVDQHPEIAGANGVMGVPTVVMLKGGEVKERFVGVQPKEVIKEKVSALI